MKYKARLAFIFVIFMSLNTTVYAYCDPGEIKIKFSHITSTNKHPKGIAASLLAKRINQEMDSKACMVVFPNAILYDDDKIVEAVLNNEIQLAAPSLSKFEPFTKKLRIFDLPFMFKNIDAVNAFQNSKAGDAIKNSMQPHGIQGLAFWHSGMKQFSANKPLRQPRDAQGLKFRVMASEIAVEQIKVLEGFPQQIAFNEVYSALQQRIIDGQENTWANIYGKKLFEVQDSITETNHGVLNYLVVTSVDWLKSLPDDVRTEFLTIVKEVTEERNQKSYEINYANRQAILDAGGDIVTLTNRERRQWTKAMRPVWKKFREDIGQNSIKIVQRINHNY